MFFDDIVDDEVLPYLSLAVDGLTEAKEGRSGKLELRPEDVAAQESIQPDTTMPVATLDPEVLEVYGWESSVWKKVKELFGLLVQSHNDFQRQDGDHHRRVRRRRRGNSKNVC